MTEPRTIDAKRERAIADEYLAVVKPHRERINELYRLIAIEQEHIAKKGKAVMMKSEMIAFTVPPRTT